MEQSDKSGTDFAELLELESECVFRGARMTLRNVVEQNGEQPQFKVRQHDSQLHVKVRSTDIYGEHHTEDFLVIQSLPSGEFSIHLTQAQGLELPAPVWTGGPGPSFEKQLRALALDKVWEVQCEMRRVERQFSARELEKWGTAPEPSI